MADNGTGWNSPKIAPVGTALEWQLELRVPQILAMMETCKKMPCIRRPLLDKIVKLALGSGLAYKRTIVACHCGIYPKHRGGSGVDPYYAQNLVLKIFEPGYSETQIDPIMGFEKALSGPLRAVQKAFNDKKNRGGRRLSQDS